jgi:hypothetical protein
MSPAAIPTERTAFKVHSFELAEWLLWSKPDSTWAWRLTATGDGGTRLVTRIHAVYDWRNPLMGLLGVLLMEFGDFAMLRRMLRGIKARAESLVQDTAGRKNKMSRTEPGVALTPAQRILAPNAASGEGASGGFYTPTTQRPQTRNNLQLLVGLAAIAFSAVYFISDLIEVAQGGFSTFRLILTYIGEAAIPLFVIGLYAVQRPRIGRLGFGGAITYAYAYVFFTSTVIYALISGTRDYEALTKVFGAWMTVHGLILLLGGLAFGLAVVRAGVLPRWTGVCLMVGVVLVVAASGLPDIARTVAASVPAIAFIGMGAALLRDGNRCLGRATSVPQLPGIHDHAADMKRAATSTH